MNFFEKNNNNETEMICLVSWGHEEAEPEIRSPCA